MTPDPSPAADLLRSAVGRVGLATATDGELVRRYADHRDDLAFAELVHRFAPAVYALCRRHLSDPGTADDAFQAVFVLLARKAGTLTHPDRVGGWLTGTADKVARSARRRHFRRNDILRPLDSVPEPSSEASPPTDLRVILDDELAKLPPHYRTVVLLCDVDGVSRREAAVRLNIPTATLGNRLTRARAVLGRRLLRRGVLVTAGAVVSSGSVANPPARLLASAVRVALSDSPPTELLPLLIPETIPMPRGKLLLLLVTGLVLAGGVTTGVVLLVQTPTAPSTSASEPAKPTPPSASEPAKPTQPLTPTTAVRPRDPNEKPPPWVEPKFGEMVTASAFSADGKWAVTAQDYRHPPPSKEGGGRVTVYDTATWQAAHVLDLPDMNDFLRGAAISPDGKRVFLGWDNLGVHVWDTGEKKIGKKLETGAKKPMCRSLRLSPDGKTVAGHLYLWDDKGVVGETIPLWDAASGELKRTIPIPQGGKYTSDSVAFTDSGSTVVATVMSNDDVGGGTAIEWDVKTGQEKRMIDLGAAIGRERGTPYFSDLSYTTDGKRMIVSGMVRLKEREWSDVEGPIRDKLKPLSHGVWLVDRETGRLVKPLVEHRSHHTRGPSLTSDGKKLVFQVMLPSRMDRDHGGWNEDAEFVELQQWDATTWELDWVKIVPKAERWKLWNGAAK